MSTGSAPEPHYVSAEGRLSLGQTLYFYNHTKYGVIVNMHGQITVADGKTDPEVILVDDNGTLTWQKGKTAGRVFLVGYYILGVVYPPEELTRYLKGGK